MGYSFGPQQNVTGEFETINRAHAKAERWGLGNDVRTAVGAVSLEDAYAAVEPEVIQIARTEKLIDELDSFMDEAPIVLKAMTRGRKTNGHDGISKTDRITPPKPEVAHPVSEALDEVRKSVAGQLRDALDYSAWIEWMGFNGTEKPGTVQRQWSDHVDRSWDTIHSHGDEALRNKRQKVMSTQPWAKHFGVKQTALTKEQAEADLKYDSRQRKRGYTKPAPKYAKAA